MKIVFKNEQEKNDNKVWLEAILHSYGTPIKIEVEESTAANKSEIGGGTIPPPPTNT